MRSKRQFSGTITWLPRSADPVEQPISITRQILAKWLRYSRRGNFTITRRGARGCRQYELNSDEARVDVLPA